MKRTRKWAFVEQEATRLANLGLPPLEIAERLGVNRSTVTRWMDAGKLPRTDGEARTQQRRVRGKPGQSPKQWASTVRKEYDLDATDEQLVRLAEESLSLSRDRKVPPQVRLAAAGRYQALVRQLALITRRAVSVPTSIPVPSHVGETMPEPAKESPARIVRKPGADPRTLLQAVK